MRYPQPLVAAVLLGSVWTAAPAQDTATAVLDGRVLDVQSGRPVAAARVELIGTRWRATTGEEGRFRLAGVEPGSYRLEVERLAYATVSDSILIPEGGQFRLEVGVTPNAIEIEPLVVVGRSAKLVSVGFYRRQGRAPGMFFTRPEIEERSVVRVSDLLVRLPGIRRVRRSDGTSGLEIRGRKTMLSDCSTQYFIDGVPANLMAAGIDGIAPEAIEGIEVYRGAAEVPAQFTRGRSMCGAVLIWMRTGR